MSKEPWNATRERRRFLKQAAVVAGGTAGMMAFADVSRFSTGAFPTTAHAAADKKALQEMPPLSAEQKGASRETKDKNAAIWGKLPFDNRRDYENAKRGLLAQPTATVIRSSSGHVVWDFSQYTFLDGDKRFDTVNPSLKRQAELNNLHGLFQLTDRLYQVRGYDLANMGIIVGDTGYIVIDPLTSTDTSRAALELVYRVLGEKPVVAVIYSHSHADHWAGVKGVVAKEDKERGKLRIIAPEGFMEAAVSENVLAGNAMIRRTYYMYGALLPRGPQGQIDAGIGKSLPRVIASSMISPTDTITRTGQEMVVDGVRIIFQNVPHSEAPANMHLYFPDLRALFMADNCVTSLHNLLTPRGAQVRDALLWAGYIYEAIDLFAERSDIVFVGHGHPLWGKDDILFFLKTQADAYKYIHDQTLRLANEGRTMEEIAEEMTLPDVLDRAWFNRGYYATVGWNAKAVYQHYLGWHDANPANMHALPPVEKSLRYVAFMGGPDELLRKARASFDAGDYRWVAEVVNHLVFAEPENEQARRLQADTLEQLGYQEESAVFRNFYLQGALELREGVKKPFKKMPLPPDVVEALTLDMIFSSLSVRLNPSKAKGKRIAVNWLFTDTGEKYLLHLENAVLKHKKNCRIADADATLILARPVFNGIITGESSFLGRLLTRKITYEGSLLKFRELMSFLDEPELWFNIVTP